MNSRLVSQSSQSRIPSNGSFRSLSTATNASNFLSPRQVSELNTSILQYLKPLLVINDGHLFNTLITRLTTASPEMFHDTIEPNIPENFLEKKWSTVLRLQKKIQDLENQLEQSNEANEQLSTLLSTTTSKTLITKSKLNWIPTHLKTSLKFHNSSITAVAIHPYNPTLATASQDGTIVIWSFLDFSQPECIIKNAHSRSITSLKFQPSSPALLVSSSSDMLIKIWNLTLDTFKVPISTLTGHEHIVSDIAFSRNNPTNLISCSRDKSIKIWDITTGWCLKTIIGHSDWVRSVSACNNFILSCSSDLSVRLTHVSSGNGIGLCLGHNQVIEDVKFLPKISNEYLDSLTSQNGSDEVEYEKLGYKYAVSCGRDNLIKFWKLPLPDLSTEVPKPGSNPNGTCIFDIKGHKSWVRKLTVHPSGKYIVSCSDDKTIKCWDLEKIVKNNTNNNGIEATEVLEKHDNFVNTVVFAEPVLDERYWSLVDSNNEIDQVKTMNLLKEGMRCYLVSGGADNVVNIWD